MKFDPASRVLDGLNTFLAFIALNVVYLVCCLPLITIGVATSALYEVTMRYADEERGHLLLDFFLALKRNAVRATAVSLSLLAPCVALLFAGFFWVAHPSVIAGGAAVLTFIAAAYVFAAFLYGMALVAAFENTFRQTLKNALLLPAAEPIRTIAILIVPVVVVCLALLFPAFWAVVVTIGFSVGAYGTAFLFRNVFRRRRESA